MYKIEKEYFFKLPPLH